MSGRKLLEAALKAALPTTWQIVADARALDGIRKPGAAVLWTARRARPPKLGLDAVQDELRALSEELTGRHFVRQAPRHTLRTDWSTPWQVT